MSESITTKEAARMAKIREAMARLRRAGEFSIKDSVAVLIDRRDDLLMMQLTKATFHEFQPRAEEERHSMVMALEAAIPARQSGGIQADIDKGWPPIKDWAPPSTVEMADDGTDAEDPPIPAVSMLKPSDAEIVKAVADRYCVTTTVAINWLKQLTLS